MLSLIFALIPELTLLNEVGSTLPRVPSAVMSLNSPTFPVSELKITLLSGV